MTREEQERPRTEAGIEGILQELAYHVTTGEVVLLRHALAAVEDARTEGRQQAVREIEPLLAILPTGDSPLPDQQLVEHWVPEVARVADDVREWVAGLNASESPPTLSNSGGTVTNVPSPEFHDGVRATLPVGDASESGQPPEA